VKFTLLTREGCGLCEEFEQELCLQFPALLFERAEVDSREDWRRRYGLKIPVLLDGRGDLVCATVIDVPAVAAAIC